MVAQVLQWYGDMVKIVELSACGRNVDWHVLVTITGCSPLVWLRGEWGGGGGGGVRPIHPVCSIPFSLSSV